ncbi:glycosyltransferase [Psychrosphaera sp.]|nr:glycosyltransferase [Psychrosphaera sp.]
MKVLVVVTSALSVESFLEGQFKAFVEDGIDVHLAVNLKTVSREVPVGVTVHDMGFKREVSPIQDMKSLLKLIWLINKISPDIVHTHTPKASLLGCLAARLCNVKAIVYHLHGLVSIEAGVEKKSLVSFVERLPFKLSTHVLCVSSSLQQWVVNKGYCSSAKISTLAQGSICGVDVKEKFNIDKVNAQPSVIDRSQMKEFVVGYAGRVCEDKGLDDFLKVIEALNAKSPVFTGLIVGPIEDDKYNNLNELPNIIHVGHVQNVNEYMVNFDVLLLLSKREGFGLVAAEANALEVPVVCYQIPGLEDAVGAGETATVVEYQRLEEATNAVWAYYQDNELKKRHGKAGKTRVTERYNPEVLTACQIDFYKSISSKRVIK